jgi:hypothetical protein
MSNEEILKHLKEIEDRIATGYRLKDDLNWIIVELRKRINDKQ